MKPAQMYSEAYILQVLFHQPPSDMFDNLQQVHSQETVWRWKHADLIGVRDVKFYKVCHYKRIRWKEGSNSGVKHRNFKLRRRVRDI